MAVIPPDAGVRLRLQSDQTQLQALSPARGIPSDLPEFQSGQVFTARIQEVLPDATYRALVSGRQLTLQLPEGANPGDVLQLKVLDRTAAGIVAQRTEPQGTGAADNRPYPYMRISSAGRLIGSLLPPEGEAPKSVELNGSQPLLNHPPLKGAELAPMLQKAVSQSGLFYEAHQAQWVAGERTLSSLRAEPQGQQASAHRQESVAGRTGTPSEATISGQAKANVSSPEAAQQSPSGAQSANSAPSQGNAASLPEAIRNVVQQQLDAVATQRLAWHGEVWPGQTVDWAIQRDTVDERGATESTADAPSWSTSLRLTMPKLGTIDAALHLASGKLSVRLAADSAAAAAMRSQATILNEAFSSAGLTVRSLDIRHED